jgi:hypothetical protein
MAGEINGTKVVIQNGTGEIVGGGDLSFTYGGTPIDISNKSYGDNITLLDGEGATKQYVFTGDFTFNSDTQFRKVRDDAFSFTMDTYTVTILGSGTANDESMTGLFMPNGLGDSYPMGAKVVTSLTFSSSGEVTRTPASDT